MIIFNSPWYLDFYQGNPVPSAISDYNSQRFYYREYLTISDVIKS